MLLFTWQGQVASGDPPGRGIGLPRSSGTADPGECKLRPAFLDADFQGPRVTTLRVKKSRMDHHHHEYNRCLSDVMQVNAGTSLCFNIPSGPGRRKLHRTQDSNGKMREESCSFLANTQLEINLGGYPLIHIRSSHPSHPADAFAVSQAVEISWKVAVLRVSPVQSSNAVVAVWPCVEQPKVRSD